MSLNSRGKTELAQIESELQRLKKEIAGLKERNAKLMAASPASRMAAGNRAISDPTGGKILYEPEALAKAKDGLPPALEFCDDRVVPPASTFQLFS